MPFNISGTLAPLQILVNPRIVLPSLVVQDIRQLDFLALRRAGYRGAVFDKDNCLTLPHRDRLVPELEDAWKACRETFGPDNVLVVSNTAGTSSDAGLIQAESVSHHLCVPVLRHRALKPSYACARAIRGYFSHLEPGELVVVGDRVLTDVVLANRMKPRISFLRLWSRLRGGKALNDEGGKGVRVRGPLAIWTACVWERDNLVLRQFEAFLVKIVSKLVHGDRQSAQTKGYVKEVSVD